MTYVLLLLFTVLALVFLLDGRPKNLLDEESHDHVALLFERIWCAKRKLRQDCNACDKYVQLNVGEVLGNVLKMLSSPTASCSGRYDFLPRSLYRAASRSSSCTRPIGSQTSHVARWTP